MVALHPKSLSCRRPILKQVSSEVAHPMQEEYTTCENCGRQIPRTQFCIYCGVNISKSPSEQSPESDLGNIFEGIFETTETRQNLEIGEAPFFQSPYKGYQQEAVSPLAIDLGLDPEITQLTKELAKFQLWKVRLCGMLLEGEVPEKVFSSIYEDYSMRVQRLEERRNAIVADYRAQYDERKRELEEARLKLEELRVRVELGELTESEKLIRTPGLEGEVFGLEDKVSKLENILEQLESLSAEASSREIFGYEETARKFLNSLGNLISAGKIDGELGTNIRGDLEGVLGQLSKMHRGGDEEEMSLRNELEVLDVQYKVGEITLSEFESMRRGIVEKLERHWERST